MTRSTQRVIGPLLRWSGHLPRRRCTVGRLESGRCVDGWIHGVLAVAGCDCRLCRRIQAGMVPGCWHHRRRVARHPVSVALSSQRRRQRRSHKIVSAVCGTNQGGSEDLQVLQVRVATIAESSRSVAIARAACWALLCGARETHRVLGALCRQGDWHQLCRANPSGG
jgi:hypothetical protein